MKKLLFFALLISSLSICAQTTPSTKTRSDGSFTQADAYLSIIRRLGIPTAAADDLNASIAGANTAKLIYNTTLEKLRIYDPISSQWKDASPADLSNFYTKLEVDASLANTAKLNVSNTFIGPQYIKQGFPTAYYGASRIELQGTGFMKIDLNAIDQSSPEGVMTIRGSNGINIVGSGVKELHLDYTGFSSVNNINGSVVDIKNNSIKLQENFGKRAVIKTNPDATIAEYFLPPTSGTLANVSDLSDFAKKNTSNTFTAQQIVYDGYQTSYYGATGVQVNSSDSENSAKLNYGALTFTKGAYSLFLGPTSLTQSRSQTFQDTEGVVALTKNFGLGQTIEAKATGTTLQDVTNADPTTTNGANFGGLVNYSSDLSSSYTDRSLVDKAFVIDNTVAKLITGNGGGNVFDSFDQNSTFTSNDSNSPVLNGFTSTKLGPIGNYNGNNFLLEFSSSLAQNNVANNLTSVTHNIYLEVIDSVTYTFHDEKAYPSVDRGKILLLSEQYTDENINDRAFYVNNRSLPLAYGKIGTNGNIFPTLQFPVNTYLNNIQTSSKGKSYSFRGNVETNSFASHLEDKVRIRHEYIVEFSDPTNAGGLNSDTQINYDSSYRIVYF